MKRWWNVKRFDLVEVCLLTGLFVCGASYAGYRVARSNYEFHEESRALESAFGPERFSENEEEWIIRDFFGNKRNGFFVDVGAGHYRANSNTYYLESRLGWSGLAVEPFRHFEAEYLAHRPRTRFLPFFVSNVSNEAATLYTLGEDFAGNSSDRRFVERFGKNPKQITAATITLTDLFDRENVGSIDFMSMDIELSEPKALAGLDINRYRPSLVCIEAHPEVRQQIIDYFTRNRYILVGKYLRADDKNLYFIPL